MNRCDICVEETCKGLHNCKCETCDKLDKCYRVLRPTIRITTKCTQECEHCCFKCSPNGNKFMSIETAQNISKFLENNQITSLNVMGGEFFLNPDWYDIIVNLGSTATTLRLVTTGDWVNSQKDCDKLLRLKDVLKDKLWISVSNDQWHNNKNVDKAAEFLERNKFLYNTGTKENDKEDVLVPIGRAEMTFGFYSMFGCYCHKPQNMYSFLINETGEIYKCGFGVWDYANINEYLDGGFRKKFKEFNLTFHSIFLSSCKSCIRTARSQNRLDLQNE